MYPILKIGNLSFSTYGIIALLTFLFTYWLIKFYALKDNFDYRRARDMYLYSLVSAFVGAKLFVVITELPLIVQNPRQLKTIIISGGVFYGGLLTGILFFVFYAHYQKLNLLQMLDIIAPVTVLSMAIDRWGCFASGCCFGRPTDVPWAVTFNNPLGHALHPDLPYVPIHPTQIYLSLMNFIIFIILNILYRKKEFHGKIFFSYLLLYGIGRFIVEYYRFDYRGIMLGGYFSTSQLIAVVSSILSLLLLIYLFLKSKKIPKKVPAHR